jgi:hypothetical protein
MARTLVPALAFLTLALPALAQTGATPPGQEGDRQSSPMSTHASNISSADARSTVAPTLPSPDVGPGASPVSFLQAARGALAAGRTGEAQEALERAQTRLLDRSVPFMQTNQPTSDPAVAQISSALRALSSGDRGQAIQQVDAAITTVQQTQR